MSQLLPQATQLIIQPNSDTIPEEFMRDTEESTLPSEIANLWTFTASYNNEERFYIVTKRVPEANYTFELHNDSTQIKIIMQYTPIDEDKKKIAACFSNVKWTDLNDKIERKEHITIIQAPEKLEGEMKIHLPIAIKDTITEDEWHVVSWLMSKQVRTWTLS